VYSSVWRVSEYRLLYLLPAFNCLLSMVPLRMKALQNGIMFAIR
jgi:hypothetical protein